MTTLAIDIGGTKMEAGIVEDDGTVRRRVRTLTAARGDGESLFGDLMALVDRVAPDGDYDRVGVGCGGPMTGFGASVSPLNIPAWRHFPLRDRLATDLGGVVHVDNDAKAFALGEGWLGAAVGCTDYVALVVSTGIGGGVVSGGALLDGATGNAGHIGHVFVADGTSPWEGHPAGLLESEASGTAIAVRTGTVAAQAPPEVVERTGVYVGRGIASVANLLDLRLAVVGGSVALGFGAPFFAVAQAEVDRLCQLDYSAGTTVVPAGLGPDGPLVGAAAVALRAEGHDVGIR